MNKKWFAIYFAAAALSAWAAPHGNVNFSDPGHITANGVEVKSLNVKGSVAPQGTTLDYADRGIWRKKVMLDKPGTGQYLTNNIYFAFNDADSLALRRVPGSNRLTPPGAPGENIRLNPGCYELTVDLEADTFGIAAEVNPWRVSVFGSSVANGEGAENHHGYAWLYGKLLEERTAGGRSSYPFHISGVSIGGNTTTALLNRYDDLTHDFGHYVMIGLSLGNEGIHGAAAPESVFAGFRDNLSRLIAKIRADGKEPVVVNNYTRSDYNATDYEYIRRMNLLIHQWDVPSVNVLGAIDDGAGRWAEGYIADMAHPDSRGHREFSCAIVPSLFDALAQGKPQPRRDTTCSYTLTDGEILAFRGEETVHPFTVTLRIKGDGAGRLLKFGVADNPQHAGTITVSPDGELIYTSPYTNTVTTADNPLADGDWHDVTLTHFHAMGRTFLYIDGALKGSVAERIALGDVVVGDPDNSASRRDISEVSFWRSGMNADGIAAHHQGRMLKSSLEIYSPMQVENGTVANRAQSLNRLSISRGNAPR